MSRNKRIALIVAAAVAMCVLMAVVGYAIGYLFLEVKENYFHTGVVAVDIDFVSNDDYIVELNPEDNAKVFYEPGMRVRGDFVVCDYSYDEKTNTYTYSSDPEGIYYGFYFSQLDGDLKNYLYATIYDENNQVIMSGNMSELADRTAAMQNMQESQLLEHRTGGNSRKYTLELYFPEAWGNEAQEKPLSFALSVVAMQASNVTEEDLQGA